MSAGRDARPLRERLSPTGTSAPKPKTTNETQAASGSVRVPRSGRAS